MEGLQPGSLGGGHQHGTNPGSPVSPERQTKPNQGLTLGGLCLGTPPIPCEPEGPLLSRRTTGGLRQVRAWPKAIPCPPSFWGPGVSQGAARGGAKTQLAEAERLLTSTRTPGPMVEETATFFT